MLEEAGWRCETARTGVEALELLRIPHPSVSAELRRSGSNSPRGSLRFSCVVTDCMMPEMDGCELARVLCDEAVQRRLRRGDRSANNVSGMPTPLIPVIGLTGNVEPAELDKCRRAGMCRVLAKPIEMAELLQAVSDASHTAAAGARGVQPQQSQPRGQQSAGQSSAGQSSAGQSQPRVETLRWHFEGSSRPGDQSHQETMLDEL